LDRRSLEIRDLIFPLSRNAGRGGKGGKFGARKESPAKSPSPLKKKANTEK
jgi:hypothetical protein